MTDVVVVDVESAPGEVLYRAMVGDRSDELGSESCSSHVTVDSAVILEFEDDAFVVRRYPLLSRAEAPPVT